MTGNEASETSFGSAMRNEISWNPWNKPRKNKAALCIEGGVKRDRTITRARARGELND
jgi:hypothetical protein